MEYLCILKEESNNNIKKFNEIKQWFFQQITDKKINYCFENDINFNKITSNNFFIITPNVIPLLVSKPLEKFSILNQSFISQKEKNVVSFICKTNNFSENMPGKIYIDDLVDILSRISYKKDTILVKYNKKNYLSNQWFYIDNIPDFLNHLEKTYFSWYYLNYIKLILAPRYPRIIYYDGKNKYESKKMIAELGVPVPETYDTFENLNQITQDGLDKLPKCIIKPTNSDGGYGIVKQKNLQIIKKKLNNFEKKGKTKELGPLIRKYHKPLILAEEYIKDFYGKYTSPCELKFYIFNGEIAFFLGINKAVNYDGFSFFDKDFNQFSNSEISFDRTILDFKFPHLPYFDKLKEDIYKIYEKFVEDVPSKFINRFIRMDFYVSKDKYYFGEFALFPNGGYGANLNEYGKLYFAETWLPEVFQILRA